jgi:hypothetical protein
MVTNARRWPSPVAVGTQGIAADVHAFEILDATLLHRFAPARIGAENVGRSGMIVFGQAGRLNSGNLLPRHEFLAR